MNPNRKQSSFGRFIAAVRPSHIAPIVALLGVGTALRYAISEETPVGRVKGHVLLAESRQPLGEVHVTLMPISAVNGVDEEETHIRRAVSDEHGQFSLAQVPAGSYYLSASTRAHSVTNDYVTVDEGGTSEPTLMLTKSEPDLALGQHQRVFGTEETVKLPVKGFIDGAKTKGTDAVRIRLYRTRLSNLVQSSGLEEGLNNLGVKYGSQGDREAVGLPPELLKPANGPAPSLFLDKEFRVTEADREGFYFQRFAFGSLPAGLYLTQVDHDKHAASTWLLITDTALVVKRANKQLLAYTVNMKSGVPLSSTDIRVYKDGKIAAQSKTDSAGLCQIALPDKAHSEGEEGGDDSHYMSIAIRGDDEALVERSNYYSSEENGKFAVAAYTDRPIYRPGHRISFKGVARRTVEKGVQYSMPTGEPVAIEVFDPKGDSVFKQRLVANRFGSFFGAFDLSSEARTGVYTLSMTLGGEKHTHGIVVASYRKPEFEVTVSPVKKTYVRGEMIEMNVTGKYYFGAPLAGATAHYYVDKSTDWSAEYPDDYEYSQEEDNVDSRYYGRERYRGQSNHEGDVRLDENGSATLRFPADVEDTPNSPQQHIFRAYVTVTDESKREVASEGEAKVTAGDYKLTVRPEGYLAAPKQPMSVTLRVTDLQGAAIPNARVELEESYSHWKNDKYENKVFHTQAAVSGADGRAIVNVVPPAGGNVELKAKVLDAKGRSIRAHADVWCSGDEGGDLDTEYADLSLAADKRKYVPGETARVLINAARTGQTVLVTVEGARIYKTFTIPMKQKSSVVKVPLLAEYGPNVTLAACYVREKGFARSEIPLRVTVASRAIKVAVWSDPPANPVVGLQAGKSASDTMQKYHPRDMVTYHVKTTDAQGKPAPCEFSMGVVDESIYALAEDDPRVMQDTFYPHRSNSVSTEFSFAVQYLGDADKAEPKIVARKEFPDTVFWAPSLETDGQGLATIRVPLKDNLTTWRATVVAQTGDSAFGRETNKVISTKEFLVRVETPRFLTARDQSKIVALVHNETDKPQTALVRLRIEGITTSDSLDRTMEVKPGAAAEVVWNVTATDAEKAKVDVSAWTPKVAGGTQYTDRVETSIPIRAHGREEITTFSGEVTDRPTGETVRLDPTSVPRATRMTVRITPSVAGSLVGAVDYLVGYPYGCTEQTMSRFLPDLLVQRALKQRGNVVSLSAARVAELPKMVQDGITRLSRFQHDKTGAWGWWDTDADDPWMTAYVLYGLSTAKREGYAVNPKVLERGFKAATELLAKTQDDDDKAFLIYAMALGGKDADKSTARIVRNNIKLTKLNPASLAYIVLLDRLLGNSPAQAFAELEQRAVSENGALCWKNIQTTVYSHHSWDDRMMTAMGLRAMLAVNPSDPRVNDILRWLMKSRTGEYWEDTRATTWVLSSLCDYLNTGPGQAAPTGVVTVKLNGQPVQSYSLTPESTRSGDLVLPIPAASLTHGKNDLTFERTGGSSAVFYSVELRQTLASEDMPAFSPSKISIKREFLKRVSKKAGTDYWTLQTEESNNKLNQGDRVVVRLTIDVPQDASYVLIEDPFPSGCEVTERATSDDVVDWSYWWSSIDIRDDRIAFFARDLTKGQHVIEYNLRAQTPGAYHTLPTMLQAMYEPSIRAYSPEARIEIR